MSSSGLSAWTEGFSSGIRPKKNLRVWEWADNHRVLPDASAEPGPYRTSRTPYAKEIMDELSEQSDAQKVVWKAGSQVGKTEVGNNWVGYTIDHDPATMMIVWPTLHDVKQNQKLRITPLLDDNPRLKAKIYGGKGRSDGSTARFKKFDGGSLIINGAESASGLKSIPAKKLMLDEIDEYPHDVENQGDPISLVMVRSRTFGSKRKAYLCSTPTYKGKSKISKEFRASDQRYYYVPCPHCKEKQILEWERFSYETEDAEDGQLIVTSCSYFCKHCGEEIEEYHKSWMMSEESGASWIKHNPKSNVPGFHLAAFYSPLGWYSWLECAQEYIEATHDQEKMKTWTNTVKAEEYEVVGVSPDHESLYDRREKYEIGTVPRGVVFLTCAVDVQGDRLEAEVMGWGRNMERWSIEHKVIPGKPTSVHTWDALSQYLASEFEHVDGKTLGIMKCGVDSGYEAQRVYNFCKKYDVSKVLPIKGQDGLAIMVGTPTAVNLKNEKTGKKQKRGVRIWPIGVSMVKDELFGDLQLDQPDDIMDGFPKGFIHFPMYDEEYFRQLTAEKKVLVKDKKGFTKSVYVKEYERNEILDLHVYNRAMASIIGIDRLNESGWQRLEEQNSVALNLKADDNRKEDRLKRMESRKAEESDFWGN